MKFASELPYPEAHPTQKLSEAKLLMPSYAGIASELTAVTTYTFQSLITESKEELSDALAGIAKVEMKHMRLLGQAIYRLGGYPIMGARSYWSGNMAGYTLDPKKFLRMNIASEEAAIANYERTILALSDDSVKLLLERIILDEELHIEIFKELLKSISN